MQPSDDPSWSLYPETLVEFFREDGTLAVRVDLREPVDDLTRSRLAGLGLSEAFALLTAFNPRGRNSTTAENQTRDSALISRLRAMGVHWMRADGVSRDSEHRERGTAIALDRDAARQLACEMEQSAFFWFDGARFWIIGALVDAPAKRLC